MKPLISLAFGVSASLFSALIIVQRPSGINLSSFTATTVDFVQKPRLTYAEIERIYRAIDKSDDPALLKPLLSHHWTYHDDSRKTIVPNMARMEKWQCVKWLVEHRYSVDTPDSLGRTALWYACATSSISLIKTLLDAGADINRAETFDKELTPLGITITAERYVVLDLLHKSMSG